MRRFNVKISVRSDFYPPPFLPFLWWHARESGMA
jgi:hypothetical protein